MLCTLHSFFHVCLLHVSANLVCCVFKLLILYSVMDGWEITVQWWNGTDRGNWSAGIKTLYSVCVCVADEWVSMEQWWNGTDRGKPKYWAKTWASATVSTTSLTWTRLEWNAGLCGQRPATNRPSQGTAVTLNTENPGFVPVITWQVAQNVCALNGGSAAGLCWTPDTPDKLCSR